MDMRNGASTCQQSFHHATHSLQVVFSGGMTKDGVTPLDAHDANQFFIVRLDGQRLFSEILGLADLRAPDNYIEICLDISHEQLKLAYSTSLEVESPCQVSTRSALYAPKGLCIEKNSACSAAAC